MLLRMKGINCDIAYTATQTLDMVQRNGSVYQVVFIDHDLPSGGWGQSGVNNSSSQLSKMGNEINDGTAAPAVARGTRVRLG